MRPLTVLGIIGQGIVMSIYAVVMFCVAVPFALLFFLFVLGSFLFDEFILKVNGSYREYTTTKMLPPVSYPLQRCLILRYKLPKENELAYSHYVVAGNATTMTYRKMSTQNEYAKEFFKEHLHDDNDMYIQSTAQAIVWLRKMTSQYEINCQVFTAELEPDGEVTMKLVHF